MKTINTWSLTARPLKPQSADAMHASEQFQQSYWTDGIESFWIGYPAHPNPLPLTHAHLADVVNLCTELGYSIKDALIIACMHAHRNHRLSKKIDFLDHWPEEQIDLPYVSPTPLLHPLPPFKPCKIGLYPVVDSSHWVDVLLSQGVKCIQLRVKEPFQAHLEAEIERSVFLAQKYEAILFINDYWDLAIRFGAQGVHLGQEDLQHADMARIHQAGLSLGVSTHGYYEVARAHTLNPSYIACGPIYPTNSKVMSVPAQGIDQLKRWRRTLDYPLVAIGGINLERLPDVLNAGVEGIALISAITQARDPLAATQQFLTQMLSIA